MKKGRIFLAVLAILLVLAGVGVKQYRDHWNATYIEIDEQVIRRDVTELDYRGKNVPDLEVLMELDQLKYLDLRDTGLTVQEYASFSKNLPSCTIRWSVPFRDGYLSDETTELTLDALHMEDLEELENLSELRTLYLTDCADAEVILALHERFPELEAHYSVMLGGESYKKDTAEITLEDADIEELERVLPCLPKLERLSFAGKTPDSEQIYQLKVRYPNVVFVWDFEVLGVPANSEDTELVLSGIPMETVDAVESALKYFRNLERVEMCGCGIPSEEMDALWKRHPQTRFVWTVYVGRCELRTDVTAFMPYKFGYAYADVLEDEEMGELKYCVDMVCMDLGHMDVSDYSFLENMTKLQYLVLADTLGDDFHLLANLKELVFLELFVSAFEQTEALTGLTKLEDLNVSYTNVDNIEPLKEMTWLKRLWMIKCDGVSEAEATALQEALPDTQVVFSGTHSLAGGWRTGKRYFEMRDLLGMHYMQ